MKLGESGMELDLGGVGEGCGYDQNTLCKLFRVNKTVKNRAQKLSLCSIYLFVCLFVVCTDIQGSRMSCSTLQRSRPSP